MILFRSLIELRLDACGIAQDLFRNKGLVF